MNPLLGLVLVLAVTADPTHAGTLTLSWLMDPSAEISGFVIERAPTCADPFSFLARTTTPAVLEYVDPGLVEGASYCYQVRAYLQSVPSNTASGTVPITTPPPSTDVSKTCTGGCTIDVPPYQCVRLAGGTSWLLIKRNGVVIAGRAIGNPSALYTMRCQVDATQVHLYLNGVLWLTGPR